jgi:hypothetical protein
MFCANFGAIYMIFLIIRAGCARTCAEPSGHGTGRLRAYMRPWHGPVARVHTPSHPDGHVHPITRGTSSGARRRAVAFSGRQPVARARRLVVVLVLAERPPSSCHGLACIYLQRRASAGGLYVEDAHPLATQRGRRDVAGRVDGWRRHPGAASMPMTRCARLKRRCKLSSGEERSPRWMTDGPGEDTKRHARTRFGRGVLRRLEMPLGRRAREEQITTSCVGRVV